MIATKLIGVPVFGDLEIEDEVVSSFTSATDTPDALDNRNSLGFRLDMGRGERNVEAKLSPRKHPKSLDRLSLSELSAAGSLATMGPRECHHETAWPLVCKLPLLSPRNNKHPPSIRLCSDTHTASSFALEPSHLPNAGKQHVIRSFLEAEMVRKARPLPSNLAIK